jgi:hypothetical protein
MANPMGEGLAVASVSDHITGGNIHTGGCCIFLHLVDGFGLGFKDNIPDLREVSLGRAFQGTIRPTFSFSSMLGDSNFPAGGFSRKGGKKVRQMSDE